MGVEKGTSISSQEDESRNAGIQASSLEEADDGISSLAEGEPDTEPDTEEELSDARVRELCGLPPDMLHMDVSFTEERQKLQDFYCPLKCRMATGLHLPCSNVDQLFDSVVDRAFFSK